MNLWTESLWGDEAFSALAVKLKFAEMLSVVMKDTSPPLFYLAGYVWGRLFGFSEVALRSLTLILILGTAVMAGLLVYELGKNKLNAVLTFALTFFSPFLLPYAFEWRMYALLAFSLTASTYCFMTKRWKGYVVAALAALYTHHFAIFTIFAQGIIYLLFNVSWKNPRKIWRELWPYYLIGIGYSFWLYPMYIQVSRVKGAGFWLTAPTVKQVFDLLGRLAIGGVDKPWQIVAVFIASITLALKDWKKQGIKILALVWIGLVPVFLSAALSYVITPIFYDRYLLSVVPMAMVVLGLGLRKEYSATLLTMAFLFVNLSVYKFTHPGKLPFREMAESLKKELKDGDIVINYNGNAHHLWESKYYGVPGPIYTPNGPLPLYVGTAQMKPEDTTVTLPTPKRRLAVISSEDKATMKLPGFTKVSEKDFGALNYSFWVKQK